MPLKVPIINKQKCGDIMAGKADAIAVIDSGVGGISVLRELVRLMPNERFLYFGDSANAPYGTKKPEEVQAMTDHTVKRLMQRGIKALVVACNTATAVAIAHLRAQHPDFIIIGIEPAVKPAVLQFPKAPVGIMATPVTLRGEKLKNLIAANPHPDLHLIPAPGLVELVEAGLANSPQMDAFLTPILQSFRGKLAGLVLGCTHYPFAIPAIRRVLGEETVLFDGGAGTARETRRRLECAGLLSDGPGSVVFENSLEDPHIISLCENLLTEAYYG